MHSPEVIAELKKNQETYDLSKDKVEAEHWGRTVLLHDGVIVAIYNDEGDAYAIGCEKFGLGHFSLHRVGEKPFDIGFHALSLVSERLDMPSFEQNVTDNRIIIIVRVSNGLRQTQLSCQALLDTGAQITAISPKVVENLGLVPTGPCRMIVASGDPIDTYQYHARVEIPIDYNLARSSEPQRFSIGSELSVASLPYEPEGHAVILGMDFIGKFHITMFSNKIILSN